ncbi:hypothetical protein MIMGU_mgv11b016013mg [Erythranthe guttata]|uniref:Uncharacterized protein n=1 Tax=Erythranthe guttata TaxID=4155 RepID=A0A022Q569_ERYGU|nr:hypothetical protein MIMGU_mgv11b016013mg [Erythranthe guttata]
MHFSVSTFVHAFVLLLMIVVCVFVILFPNALFQRCCECTFAHVFLHRVFLCTFLDAHSCPRTVAQRCCECTFAHVFLHVRLCMSI